MVTPLLLLGPWSAAGNAREIAEALAISVVQLGVIALILRPLESLAPAEPWTDRRLTRIDRQYTAFMLLGILPLYSYLVMMPLGGWVGGVGEGGADPATRRSPRPMSAELRPAIPPWPPPQSKVKPSMLT